MADDTTSAANTLGKGAANFAKDAAGKMRSAGEALKEGGQKVAENNQAIGLKMIEQAEQNTHEAFAAMRKAAQASDLSGVMQVQGEYLREQGSRSVAQAREIAELIANFGRDVVGAVRSSAGPRTGGE